MSYTRTTRRGFTAIELLIVVAIIGLLAAMTAGAVFRTLRSQDASYTEATLTKLASLLENHWSAVVDAAKRDYDSLPAPSKQALVTLGDNNITQQPQPHPRRPSGPPGLFLHPPCGAGTPRHSPSNRCCGRSAFHP